MDSVIAALGSEEKVSTYYCAIRHLLYLQENIFFFIFETYHDKVYMLQL